MSAISLLKFPKMSSKYAWLTLGLAFHLCLQQPVEAVDEDDLIEHSPVFYTAKAAGADDLYFAAERVDHAVPGADSRLEFWKTFVKDEQETHYLAYQDLFRFGDTQIPSEFPRVPPPGARDSSSHNAGFDTLGRILRQYSHKEQELWIFYATPFQLQHPQQVTPGTVEMVCSLMTTDQAPFALHMGINRSFGYLRAALKEGLASRPIHRNLSMALHSFGARVMTFLHPDIQYMISAPTPAMQEIFTKHFPGTSWLGDNWLQARKRAADSPSPRTVSLQAEIDTLTKQLDDTDDGAVEEARRLAERIGALKKSLCSAQEQDIQRVIDESPAPSLQESPIIVSADRKHLKLYDPQRQNIIYADDRTGDARVRIGEEVFEGPRTQRFTFLHCPSLSYYPYAVVSYPALARWGKLEKPDGAAAGPQ